MFFDFFSLELKQRFKSISTYVFFLIPFIMMFFTESARDFSPVPNGKVFLNGPWALTICFVQLTAFGSILISAIFGPSILRDFQQDTYPLLFTKPISKFDYLGGRWAASFVISVLIFSGLIFGALDRRIHALGRQGAHRAGSSLDLLAAVSLHHRSSNLFSRQPLLLRGRAHPPHRSRLSAGRNPLRHLLDSSGLGNHQQQTRSHLAFHLRSARHRADGRHHALLDGSRTQFPIPALVRRVPGKSAGLDRHRPAGSAGHLYFLPDVGRSSRLAQHHEKSPRGPRRRRSRTKIASPQRIHPARHANFQFRHRARATLVANAHPFLEHFPRAGLLGHRGNHDRKRHHQRLFRRRS